MRCASLDCSRLKSPLRKRAKRRVLAREQAQVCEECRFLFDMRPCRGYRVSMSALLDVLSRDALVLPPEQRYALAYRLLVSVERAAEPGAEAAWEAEIVRRIARFDAGESQAVPGAHVFAKLREIAPGQ